MARSPFLAAGVTGFALGGFFDGIVLHQLLQWHHFLSLVPGDSWRDLRMQVLADGLFHVATYALTALGLALLWRARGGLAQASGRHVMGAALLGFGVWQLVDVGVFHWVVGIHRIRVDVPDPLLWDIGWLVVVGLPPLLLGWWLRRGGDAPGPGRGRPAAAMLALAALVAAPVAALPPPGATTSLVLFRPGIGLEGTLAAVAAADARLAWADASGGVAAVDFREGGSVAALYRHGAIMVGRGMSFAACLAWTRG